MIRLYTLLFIIFSSFAHAEIVFNYGSGNAAKSSLASSSLITSMEKVGDRIYAVGVHGIIIFSDDNGESWEQSDLVPYQNTLTDISCVTVELCWVSGHDATILHSNDSGATWSKQYEDIDFDAPILSIHMYDENEGIAIGAFALSLRTSDGGKSWGYLFIDDDEFQPHLNYVYGDNQAWRKSAKDEGYAVGELGKYYISDDRGLNWLVIETGYMGSYWSGVKVDEGQSLLFGMSGNITLSTLYDVNDELPTNMPTQIACYESGYFEGDCKVFIFEDLNIGTKNSLTSAVVLDDGRIALSGNGGVVSIVDLVRKKNIETCVRSDRLSNTSIVPLGTDEFLIAGENGIRKHSMGECYENYVSKRNNSQDSYIEVSIN
tara:strand:- start:227 stop:1351 length:1125 start_codon:yes stop_codon:yes gene_type:complete